METDLIKYLVTNFGFSTVILAIWYFCHKEWSKQLNSLIETHTKNNENTFMVLKDMIEVNLMQSTELSTIKELIKSNRWCPYISNLTKGGKLDE